MTLKKQENFIWDFGLSNALRFIQTAWKYSSNFEILLNETRFNGKLDIHISIYGDEIFKTKLKKQNFQNLKLSKWTKRDAVFSALTYIFETDSKNNKVLSNIRFYIRDQISYICNELYSTDIIQLYKKFNFFQLYPDKCIIGCRDVFISSDYSSKHSFYLNNVGLQNFLVELNVDIKIFSQIKILCNKNQNYTFFVLFLEKYTSNHYKMFFKQSEYDYFSTTTQFFTLKNVNNFIDCNSFDYDAFSLEFNKIEQQRVVTLIKIHLQKRNKVITHKSKQILIYVCKSKPIKYTGTFILISFIMGYYFAKSAFAVNTNINPPSGVSGPAPMAVSPNPSPTAENRKKPRKPRTTFTAPYYHTASRSISPENIGVDEATTKRVINQEGRKAFEQIEQVARQKSKKQRAKRILAKTKQLASSLRKEKPSDASSDVESNVPTTASLYTTKCKIIDGRLYNDAVTRQITAKSEFDKMIDMTSFEKFLDKCFFWNRTIYRAKINPDSIQPFTEQPYYVIYYPNGTNKYTVTLCGNTGQRDELKGVAKIVENALKENTKYTFGGMTFEHGVSSFYSRSYVIGITDRSNTKDTSFGLMISDSLNKRMGHNPPDLNAVYTRKKLNMFTETEQVNFSGQIFEEFLEDWVELGEKQTEELCDTTVKKELDKASKEVRKTLPPKVYDKLSEDEQLKKVHPTCKKAIEKKLTSINLSNNEFFDRDTFPLTKENYKFSHNQYRNKLKRYSLECGVSNTQTSTCAFIDQLITKARENLSITFKSIEYQQPRGSHKKQLPCPIENSVQQLQIEMDLSEGVELICKQAKTRWPDDMPMANFLKRKQIELSYINQDFSSRAKTNLTMAKNVNNLLNVYEKTSANISESTPVEAVQDLNEEASSTIDDENESVVSIADQSVENNSEGNDSSSEESETNWTKIPIPDRDAYVGPLEDTLHIFDEKRTQSEIHLNSPIVGQTDYGFITPENKDFTFQETHDYLFRGDKISLNNGGKVTQQCKKNRCVDSFYDTGQILTPAAQTVGASIAEQTQI